MWAIYKKEINTFFSSLIGYIVIGVFLVLMGLVMWVFPDYSVLDNNYANLDTLFGIAPMIFMFLIPAVTMRTFAEEKQSGTIELLVTRPVTDWQIVGGKFLASFVLVAIALIPTLLYYFSVHQLGAPPGNIDDTLNCMALLRLNRPDVAVVEAVVQIVVKCAKFKIRDV